MAASLLDDEALFWAKTALRDGPKHVPALRIAMASHALSGKLVEAKEACSRAMEIDPNQRIANIRDTSSRRDGQIISGLSARRNARMTVVGTFAVWRLRFLCCETICETWGGRIRTSAWWNQNQAAFAQMVAGLSTTG
jgi:hypothetical protein